MAEVCAPSPTSMSLWHWSPGADAQTHRTKVHTYSCLVKVSCGAVPTVSKNRPGVNRFCAKVKGLVQDGERKAAAKRKPGNCFPGLRGVFSTNAELLFVQAEELHAGARSLAIAVVNHACDSSPVRTGDARAGLKRIPIDVLRPRHVDVVAGPEDRQEWR